MTILKKPGEKQQNLARDYVLASCIIHAYPNTPLATEADIWAAGIVEQGGGFAPRPVRPAHDRRNGNFLGADPASSKIVHKPVDLAAHAAFAATLTGIAPEQR